MHFMSRSATRDRSATSERIHQCALGLADEHGIDGFTMDELAAAAGVSRRTLFNYFPGKNDAVIGVWPELGADDVALFRAGGPDGDLLLDLRTLVQPLIGDGTEDFELLQLYVRVLRENPRLLTTVHSRYEELSAAVVDHIVAREGVAFGTTGAKVAISLIGALFDATLNTVLEDPRNRPFGHHFDESLRIARTLLGA
jgi:AcrR family transcriptional regulator